MPALRFVLRLEVVLRMAPLAALFACRAEPRAQAERHLRDDFGDAYVAVSIPRRIVSLSPATTELLFALGAGPRLVGRTRWDGWPDSARLVRDVGDGLRPNVEAVLATHPDLVVLYASADNRAAASLLRSANVSTIALRMNRIADFRRAARFLGAAIGDTVRAALVADTVERTLDRVRRATGGLQRPSVFWHIWDAPLVTIGRGSYLNELVEIAGGRNVYGDLPDLSPQVTFEDLVRRDPDVVLAGAEGADRIRRSATWSDLRAIRQNRLLVTDTNLVGRPSVRLGEAAVHLASLLHPGVVR